MKKQTWMNSLEKTHSQYRSSPLSPGASWSSNQKRPFGDRVCAPGGRVPGPYSSEQKLMCTQQTKRNGAPRPHSLPPLPHWLPTWGRDAAHLALSQDPGEVSSHKEVEKAEPLTKVLNGDAPGVGLGMAKQFFFVCFESEKTQSKTDGFTLE